VYSPVRGLGDEAHRELSALGTPECLVAPNHYHHLGLAEYAAAYPGAAIVASATALPRLRKKHALAIADESRLRGALPPHISLHVPPGTRAGELWLSVAGASGRAWVVCDAFFNVAHAPRTPMGLLLRALGIAPGLRIGTSFLWLLRDRAAYCDWLLSKLAEERPTLLVPSHGDVVQDDSLPERLRALVERRLR